MLTILLYSSINGLSIILGAIFGVYKNIKQKTIAVFMAFGSGVLICALSFGLMEEAFNHGGFDAVIIGFLCGGALFIGGDHLIHKFGGRKHKPRHSSKKDNDANGLTIALGAILDGIPESIALGITLFGNQGIGLMMLAAIFISNFPEGISSSSALKKSGFKKSQIFLMWIVIGLAVTLATIMSYYFLNDLNPNNIGILEALAAGAILAMLSDSMMPEAYEDGGYLIGAVTVLGFLVAFVMSRL
jgi:zinc transporter, ZIP family